MAVSIAALAIGAGIAIYGAVKKSQAAKKARENVRPTYEIPQEEDESRQLLESQRNQGMSARSRQYYQNSADAGLATTTNAILQGGGDPNSIGSAYGAYEKGINSLAVYDDQIRLQNLANLNQSLLRGSANQDKKWQVNTYGKWADTAQALAAEQAGHAQTMNSGLNIAGQGLTGLLGAASRPKAPQMQPSGGGGDGGGMREMGGGNNGDNSWPPQGPQSQGYNANSWAEDNAYVNDNSGGGFGNGYSGMANMKAPTASYWP